MKTSSQQRGGQRVAGTRQITITVPEGIHDNLTAAAMVFGQDVGEYVAGVAFDHNADVIEGQQVGEMVATRWCYKTRAEAKRVAQRADAFDQTSSGWKLFKCSDGWCLGYADWSKGGVTA